ncbi:MAG TPA: asparagine synthase (glutamine-hydrolyzing) [Candidatus Limnocylindrales bacterium]|nr:asparagine synthase (glutamine-hydrolyzing) [Candidatus Limnocylindrales bacterium]
MCGIFGHFLLGPISPELVERMGRQLAHRGPDGTGIYRDALLSFGATRLSIIDLSAPAGPLFNEDGRVGVVLNGEVYNHRALRTQLEQVGHRFSTGTDTEVLVHGYEEWGVDVVTRLRGMFAFCLYDKAREHVTLVRDRLGEKPLYYTFTPDGALLFASEPKALLEYSGVRRAVNREAVSSYMVLGYVPAPNTLFEGIYKLAPGERLFVSPHGRRNEAYWQGQVDTRNAPPYPEAVRLVREAMTNAVSAEMVSDVPIGSFLSGGLDSSAVVALMQQAAASPVQTFTVGFDSEPGSGYDTKFNVDVRYAQLVASRLKTKHHTILLPTDDRLSMVLPLLVHQMDEPIVMPTIVQTAFVAALARSQAIPVMLTGEGGDELFMGYDHFRYDHLVSRYQRLPSLLRRSLLDPLGRRLPARFGNVRKLQQKARLDDPALRLLGWMRVVDPDRLAGLLKDETLAQRATSVISSAVSPLLSATYSPQYTDRLAYAGLRLQLAENHNMRLDRMTMAMSVEARSPLEDYQLAELALSLPLEYKLRRGGFKTVFKDAVADLLPREVLERPKWGFTPPASEWLRTGLLPLLKKTLSPERVEAAGVFRPDALQQTIHAHVVEHKYELWPLWSALIFHLWHTIYIEGDVPEGAPITPQTLIDMARIV